MIELQTTENCALHLGECKSCGRYKAPERVRIELNLASQIVKAILYLFSVLSIIRKTIFPIEKERLW